MPTLDLIQLWIQPIILKASYAVGNFILILLLIYIVGRVIYAIVNKPSAETNFCEMPLLRPLETSTKGHGLFMRFLVWINQPREWELAEDWEYQLDDEERIVLRKGFIFDGASIPRILWPFLNPVGILLIPGLVHDYGYRHRYLEKIVENGKGIVPYMQGHNKTHWDLLFLKVGNQENGMKIINFIAFLAVYLFGYLAWYGNRKKEQKEKLSSRPVIDQRHYGDQYIIPNLDFMGSREMITQ